MELLGLIVPLSSIIIKGVQKIGKFFAKHKHRKNTERIIDAIYKSKPTFVRLSNDEPTTIWILGPK